MTNKILLLTLLAVLAWPLSAFADDPTTGNAPKRSALEPSELGVWLGLSRNSPTGVFLATTPGRDFHEFAVRIDWRVVQYGYFRTDYTLDLIPFAMVTGNPSSVLSLDESSLTRHTTTRTRYGIGAVPFGLRIGVALGRLFVFGSGSAGFLIFEDAVPTPHASAFNFTIDFGGGIEAALGEHWSLVTGYKFTHLSNGDRAIENPGIDANMGYLGLGWRR